MEVLRTGTEAIGRVIVEMLPAEHETTTEHQRENP